MLYQIRWLSLLDQDPATRFLDVVEVDWKDEWVEQFRSKLFRDRVAAAQAAGAAARPKRGKKRAVA
jgi:hypothetical protein